MQVFMINECISVLYKSSREGTDLPDVKYCTISLVLVGLITLNFILNIILLRTHV